MFSGADFSGFQSSVHENLRLILTRDVKTLSEDKKFYINIHTGVISDAQALDSKEWRELHLNKTEGTFQGNCEHSEDLDQNAAAVMNLTLQILNQEREAIEKNPLEALTSLEQIFPGRTFLSKVEACFGPESADKVAKTQSTEEVANLVFSMAKQRLESTKPLDENDIKNLYQLLYDPLLMGECQKHLNDGYHPATVIALLMEAIEALAAGIPMEPTESGEVGKNERFDGLNASYYLKGRAAQKLWVFKPEDGEEQIVAGIDSGEGARREHVAAVLNYHGNYKIPYTTYISLNGRVGSAQMFLPDCDKLMALRANQKNKPYEKIVSANLHNLLLFDIRFSNTDRHMGNILCNRSDPINAFGIDHGGCMTASIEDVLCFEYLSLKQMITENFSNETKEFITNMDPVRDAAIMQEHGIAEEAIQWMRTSTALLKHAVDVADELETKFEVGLSPADLGVIVLSQREALTLSPTKETFLTYFEDICECKKAIKELHDNQNLSQHEASRLQESFIQKFNEARPDFNAEPWVKDIFMKTITPYCSHLTDGRLNLKFY